MNYSFSSETFIDFDFWRIELIPLAVGSSVIIIFNVALDDKSLA
jgi:hypothetical protein